MTVPHRDLDEVWERRFDQALREATGGEQPPDVTRRVLARHAAGDVVDEGSEVKPSRRLWLAAALALLGAGVVTGVFLSSRPERGPMPIAEPVTQAPSDPRYLVVTTLAEIQALSPDARYVEGINLGDAEVEALGRLHQLEGLHLLARWYLEPTRPKLRFVTDAVLQHLARFGGLRELVLDCQCLLSGNGLDVLAGLPMLASLGLQRFDVSDDQLAFLAKLPSLRSLDLTLNHGFRGQGIETIAACPGLRTLSLRCCSQLSDEMLKPLARLRRLETLDLGAIGRSWRGTIGEPVSAEHRTRIEAEIRAHLEKFQQAETDHAGLTDAGLTLLASLHVKSLTLTECAIDGSGFAALPVLRELISLDLSRCAKLSPRIGTHLRTICPNLRELDLSHCPLIDDATVGEVLELRELRKLDLSECPWLVTCVPLLEAASQLREVRLDGAIWLTLEMAERLLKSGKRVLCSRKDDPDFTAALQALAAQYLYRQVHSLAEVDALPDDVTHVECRGLGDEAAIRLARRPGLVGLKFVRDDEQPLTDAAFAHLAKLDKLEELVLNNVRGLRGGAMDSLAALGSLRVLRLFDLGIGDDALQFLPRLAALRELELTAMRAMGDGSMLAVSRCRGLKSLTVRGAMQLKGGALARLGVLTDLEYLDLAGLGMGDETLLDLKGLVWLRTLLLTTNQLTDHGVAALERMRDLRTLSLSGNPVGTAALLHVPTGVEELDLESCARMTKDAAALLGYRFPRLRKLRLGGDQWLDDEGLQAILGLRFLQSLQIAGCRNPTTKSLEAIRKAHSLRLLDAPNCALMTREEQEQLLKDRPDLDVRTKVW